jgi:hypothetical protein
MLPSASSQSSTIEYSWPAGVQQDMKTTLSHVVTAIAVAVVLWTLMGPRTRNAGL